MRFYGAHVVGHAENNESNDLATSALVTEIICGSRYIQLTPFNSNVQGDKKIVRVNESSSSTV